MLLLSLMLVTLEDAPAVKKDAQCAAAMLAIRDSADAESAKDETMAAQAASAYYVGKLQGYFATVPAMPFAPISAGELARNAILDASRKLDSATLQAVAKPCYDAYERSLAAL